MKDARHDPAGPSRQVVAFRVREQDYCFDLGSVREIRGWTETTRLPHAPSCVKGVINLRGAVVPVVDLSDRLGLGNTEPGPRHVIIIAVLNRQTVGLLADEVSDILTAADEEMMPVPEVAGDAGQRFLSGVLIDGDRMIRKLDLAAVLPCGRPDVA